VDNGSVGGSLQQLLTQGVGLAVLVALFVLSAVEPHVKDFVWGRLVGSVVAAATRRSREDQQRATTAAERVTFQRQTLTTLHDALFGLNDMFIALINETNEEHVKARSATRFGAGAESMLERQVRDCSQRADRLRVRVDDPTLQERIVVYQAALDVSKWTHENFADRKREQEAALTQVNDRLGEVLRGLT
jgi:hypothetical protein